MTVCELERPAAGTTGELPRLLSRPDAPVHRVAAHLAVFGPPPYRGGRQLLVSTVQAAGLTGRGGAAFPTWRKLAAVAASGRRSPVVVGNGAEGEPASWKDKTLLWGSPHPVLDGLQLVAEAVGARESYLYVHRNRQLLARLTSALVDRTEARVDRVPVRLVEAPPRFIAGEESAVVNRLEGGPTLPRFKQQGVFERGLYGAPTLVQNVETLAHISLVARYGAAWFRAIGTADEPGSMLVTVRGTDGVARVGEVPIGTPIHELGSGQQPAAWLVGGYHGTWLPGTATARLANADLRRAGGALGAGVVIALPADRCGLVETARVGRYLALESAGQCGPCLNGLPRMANALQELAGPGAPRRTIEDLERWCGLLPGRGACHHPDGSVRFVLSALTVFADELARHERGRCSATTWQPFLPVPQTNADWK
jgi:NADH:ubiquinone oxidoreductase subunit F (NADH-binding)